MSTELSGDAEPDQACRRWQRWRRNAAATSSPTSTICQRSCPGIDGGASDRAAHAAHKRRAIDSRVAAKWPSAADCAVMGATGGSAFADCRLGALPQRGRNLSQAPLEHPATRAEERVTDAPFGGAATRKEGDQSAIAGEEARQGEYATSSALQPAAHLTAVSHHPPQPGHVVVLVIAELLPAQPPLSAGQLDTAAPSQLQFVAHK